MSRSLSLRRCVEIAILGLICVPTLVLGTMLLSLYHKLPAPALHLVREITDWRDTSGDSEILWYVCALTVVCIVVYLVTEGIPWVRGETKGPASAPVLIFFKLVLLVLLWIPVGWVITLVGLHFNIPTPGLYAIRLLPDCSGWFCNLVPAMLTSGLANGTCCLALIGFSAKLVRRSRKKWRRQQSE